ncbi:TRAP transporter - DctM subunit (plasmid) [Dinoroseobacter shibae DFL 12 = DSM 16493]|jgi:tripartite ATP-independent transporter DctM subunit|uniref:TRAP transporter large permease protein n=1 Tax=Dinoroseobacter shibae (strain DSM 16493 / NCIMB 14021 / DFL 12) TaxID=398580 RepID=A8LUJ8_DINSH|nr:TRAP transporter large permease [Dinoroseobacter shibae]ABV95915.1 TRAP transporter - DctM subunit [Dinoroseobacter shibae DFL 12 = DSM 16493]URF49157.1 TRAP transporter large permease [Dinoroseobacter shibae]URF53465.1 TRAP transporter large permease [Dinoroseobacter shibae]
MTTLAFGFVLIGVLVGLVLMGMHIAIALFGVAFVGIWLIRDNIDLAFRMLELTAYSGIADYLFATIPLFVLMGLLVSVSNVGRDTFQVAEELLRRMICGLGVATVAANTIFAAVTGVSIASAAVFTRVAVPEMTRHGYRPAFSAGTVAGSSVLGMLIPPSLLLIIYGILAEVSIGGMFLAGILPGLMLAGGFVVMLIGLTLAFPRFVLADPDAVKARKRDTDLTPMPAREMIAKLTPIVLLVILVLGGLYTGFFTPTEAGGIGAFGALIVALSRRSLDRHKLWQVMKQTGVISVSILLLLVAASFYSRMLAIAGLPNAITGLVTDSGFGPLGFLFFYAVIILLMGMILDSTSILLIMVPIAAPIAQGMGIDLMHFGIVTVLAVEIGLLTPPFGISVFTVHNTLNDPDVSVESIFAATLPFIAVMLLVLVIVALVPTTATLFL